MNIWEIAILKCIDSIGGTADLQEIYSKLESGRFLKLSGKNLRTTKWEGRPAYQHQVRSHISNLTQSGDLIRVSRGVYRLTPHGKNRIH